MHQVRDSARAPFLALLALIVMSSLLGRLTVAHATTRSFPCRWNWELATNLRPGYAVAGANANCAGRAGSLTISVRLQQQDSQTHTWQTLRSRARRFHDLRKVRFVQVAKRCASSAPVKYRAKLSWTLRDTSDVAVSHLAYTAGPVTLGC
jgi:hypothetical protein